MDEKLAALVDDYWNTPSVGQPEILKKINARRKRLKLPTVDARLQVKTEAKPAAKLKPEVDHTEAKQLHERYLRCKAELAPHQEYAERVAKATHSPGMTPVEPLATMGCKGGPLLCDHCGKAMLLEGGKFNKVHADVAWRQNPQPGWKSWISGGMVVEVVENGTLRIYHGYPGIQMTYCCNAAKAARDQTEAFHVRPDVSAVMDKLYAYLNDWGLVNEVVNTLYAYDPGIGVNQPE